MQVRVREGEKERLQAFEGVCIGRRGAGDQRDVHGPQGVRRHRGGARSSRCIPRLAAIDLVRRGRVRRAKLYYLRKLSGKAARIREKRETT